MIKSPLTNNKNCIEEHSISVEKIINSYSEQLGVDVSKYFESIKNIKLNKCIDSGYRFFTPLNLAGDGRFYEQLQKFEWYYMPWKWEHKKALQKIKKNYAILEVGSGDNGFIDRLHKNRYNISGLELNQSSIERAKESNLSVYNQTIQDHAVIANGQYDVVCSFQVLEHIPDVHSFIEAQIKCLKKGGKLIISVPNNDSFIKYDGFNILNMPPHHMGLWNTKSLKSLSKVFPIALIGIYYEPLQLYHFSWYQHLFESVLISKIPIIKKIYWRFRLNKLAPTFIKVLSPLIKGHSILIIFAKN